MMWVRKTFWGLFAALLFFSLLAAVGSANFNLSLGSPEKVKELAAESGLYDELVSASLDAAQDEPDNKSSVSLKNEIVQQAAKQAFPPSYIEEKANIIIDANFAWLAGKTPTPTFSIDVTDTKQAFAQRVGTYVTERLQGLPVCTSEQSAQLSKSVDSFTVSCRPADLDPVAEGQRVTNELLQSSFLTQTTLTADTIGREPTATDKQPYYANLSSLPKLYQISQKAPWLFGLVAILSAVAVFLLATHRRKGLRRLGFVFLASGVVLLSTKLLVGLAADKISSQLASDVTAQLKQPRDDFIHHLADALVQVNLVAGLVLVLLAATILGYLSITGRQKKIERPADFHEVAEPGSTIAPAAPARPAPQPRQPQPAPANPPQPSRPRPIASYDRPTTLQFRKRSPKPRNRNLIQ